MNGSHTTSTTRTTLVLYGTETGTSQDLANEVCRILERYHFDANTEEFDNVVAQEFSQYTLVVFVLSTTGQGDFPSNARKLWTSLLRKKLTSTFLSDVHYALVGLGDSSYPRFNWAARKLHKRLQQLGAESLMDPCEADEQGEDSTDGAFINWLNAFKTMLHAAFPLPEGIIPIPDAEALPSKWVLALRIKTDGVNGVQVYNEATTNGFKPPRSQDVRMKLNLRRNERVTPAEHWQDVRFLSLESDTGVVYLPGDAVAIKPQNMAEDVQTFISLMSWDTIADEPIYIKHNRESTSTKHPLEGQVPTNTPSFTLRWLLKTNLDIKAIPRRSFFSSIARFSTNKMHQERLFEFTDPQYLDEYYDYATRPRRSVLEILQEFDSVKIPWEEVINIIPPLRPRQFSIASGGALKQQGTTFELLVAVVKYKTVIRRIREGVCTKYLAQLPVGTTIEATLKTEGRLHAAASIQQTNHLLIGAGTGVAPLRSLIHEKMDTSRPGTSTMIFGCRSVNADNFFAEEWQEILNQNVRNSLNTFEIITAFSRDQNHKVYVQDRIKEQALKVRTLILQDDATIVVCGSSGQMPKAVRQALVDVISEKTGDGFESMDVKEAEKFLDGMENAGRYKQETW